MLWSPVTCHIPSGDTNAIACEGTLALATVPSFLSEALSRFLPPRQAVAGGAHPLTMPGLAGMGDLVLTCTGACPCRNLAKRGAQCLEVLLMAGGLRIVQGTDGSAFGSQIMLLP